MAFDTPMCKCYDSCIAMGEETTRKTTMKITLSHRCFVMEEAR